MWYRMIHFSVVLFTEAYHELARLTCLLLLLVSLLVSVLSLCYRQYQCINKLTGFVPAPPPQVQTSQAVKQEADQLKTQLTEISSSLESTMQELNKERSTGEARGAPLGPSRGPLRGGGVGLRQSWGPSRGSIRGGGWSQAIRCSLQALQGVLKGGWSQAIRCSLQALKGVLKGGWSQSGP